MNTAPVIQFPKPQQEQGANVAQAVAKEIGGHAGDVIRQLVELVESGQAKPDA